MKNIRFILLVVTVLFIYSCKESNKPISKQTVNTKKINEPNPRQVVRDLVVKFPQLILGKSSKDSVFKLIRTVIDGETNIKIQLYSQDKSVKKPNQIIVFINKNNKCVAIPLFNNVCRGYWQFANEKPISIVAQTDATFEKEYNYAISLLKEGNKLEKELIAVNVTKELFCSVLHMQPITYLNRDLEICKIKYGVSDIPIENEDSVRVRFEKNYEDIKKDLENYSFYYFFDSNSHRIYGLNYDYKGQKFKFKVYRQDFGVKPIRPIYL
jgi:hypothetical protein